MLVAPAPLPTMMSMRKSSIARYSISSAERAMRCTSSMKSTSPGVRLDSSAARSPGVLDRRTAGHAAAAGRSRARRSSRAWSCRARAGPTAGCGRPGAAGCAPRPAAAAADRAPSAARRTRRGMPGRSAPSIASSASSTGSSASRSSSTGGLLARRTEGGERQAQEGGHGRALGRAGLLDGGRHGLGRRALAPAEADERLRRPARRRRVRRSALGARPRARRDDLAGELHDDELRGLRARCPTRGGTARRRRRRPPRRSARR